MPKQKERQKAQKTLQVARFIFTRKEIRHSNTGLRGSLRAVYANQAGSTKGQMSPVETKTGSKKKS